ncbi:Uncharacterized protein PBTT_09040 [Plasmodiophora brassicae]|uniref:Uncharacterized protein n=1 Tax=Plasmodiophora brassicae TaxID=37360 RepID=A0A0G4J1I5_PLABS|nr:hypothetical protein PBRA_008491 [Plasmodiophora brassicae]SPR00904.1 unnamed protein product [Plasmodiophora brassicae]
MTNDGAFPFNISSPEAYEPVESGLWDSARSGDVVVLREQYDVFGGLFFHSHMAVTALNHRHFDWFLHFLDLAFPTFYIVGCGPDTDVVLEAPLHGDWDLALAPSGRLTPMASIVLAELPDADAVRLVQQVNTRLFARFTRDHITMEPLWPERFVEYDMNMRGELVAYADDARPILGDSAPVYSDPNFPLMTRPEAQRLLLFAIMEEHRVIVSYLLEAGLAHATPELLRIAKRPVYWHVYDVLAHDSGLSGDAARFPWSEVDQERIRRRIFAYFCDGRFEVFRDMILDMPPSLAAEVWRGGLAKLELYSTQTSVPGTDRLAEMLQRAKDFMNTTNILS